ncbi:MAG: flagellar hook capping FlgD N-terminal domain-containing protein [Clostridiaceae bacterium]|nr:flagellar hook capping FlgD N-terminal domain-containing protein [Clostridiaceae bacterium]
MEIQALNSSSANSSQMKSSSDITINDFFKLIAAQLQNQSMYDSVDNTQFVSQLAQFTTLSQMTELTKAATSSLAVTMLGRKVSAAGTDELGRNVSASGEVKEVRYSSGVPYLLVDGGYYTLAEITSIEDTEKAVENTLTEEEKK